jgi:hypothetical protein
MIIQMIAHFVSQESNRIETPFVLNKTNHMHHNNICHLQVFRKNMGQQLWCINQSPHMCEMINNDRVSLVECKDHDFNHTLKCIGFHDQLKQTLLSIQISAENNGKNHMGRFPLLHFSTWTWVPIKILQDFQMSKKCCLIVYL